MLDGSKLEIGGLAENTGSPFDTNDRIRIQNIKVEPGKSYTLSGIDSNYVLANDHIFDADGNRISSFIVQLTMPDNAASASISFKKNDESECSEEDVVALKNSIMLNEGSTAKPYEPYTGGRPSPNPEYPQEIVNAGENGSIKVEVTGKNLLKPSLVPEVQGIYLGWKIKDDNKNVTISIIDKKPNESLYMGLYIGISRNGINSYEGVVWKLGSNGIVDKPVTSNGNYFTIYNPRNIPLSDIFDRYNIQIEYGITPTPYEPYTHQSLTLATPNGLPGIPVKTGGNYTDQNGQQWICDEVDLGRGKYVQRISNLTLDGVTDGHKCTNTDGYKSNGFTNAYTLVPNKKLNGAVLMNILTGGGSSGVGFISSSVIGLSFGNERCGIIETDSRVDIVNKVNAVIKEINDTGTEVIAYYELNTPIERDLTPEELAAYKSIITHNDTTVVSNNENCNMKIKYTKGVIMPQYDSTKLIVQMKALARTESMPIDSTEVWDSLAEAQSYINEANAYAGQTIKALVNGKYKTYTLQPSGGGYTLEEVGAVSQSDLKQYVQVVEQLPSSGQQQGVIYIVGTTGQIWTGSAWKVVFKEVSTQVDQLTTKVTQLEGEINKKAPINNPVFTGKVMVGSDEVAVKSYVDSLISNLVSSAPGVVDGDHPLPVDGYKAGQTWRVALAGTYAGQKCEVGDLIICIKDFNTQTNNSDFMVVQANIDGAVTSTATTSTVGEIVVFNAATGKVIKGSGVNISSLNDAISKAHTHANKAILDTYNKNQTQLLADAAITAQGKVDALKVEVDKKANKATTLAGYGITDAYTEAEIDAKLKTITDNVNTKVDAATVDSKINTAKGEIETAYNLAITEKLAARVGSIPEDTDIKTYVDTAVGSGGTASAEAIAKAKQEAINASKAYTESQLQVTEF